ncbi:hypothetical protein ERUR111494_04110 [Erysipelothrix urinaevulpis]|uniref:hypothetical protein n=1 Tax=Erysipelothrix urinaevulpis TaxID=2683717 RepID=UPI00135C4E31|nr:hypothetical protein [Erysipelothrix urinaevulpis]
MIKDFILNEAKRLDIEINVSIKAKELEYFTYDFKNNVLTIVADQQRSVLYGLYDYHRSKAPNANKKARFNRRGNIYEVINDVSYLKSQIQFGAEYYHNEIFFTFFLWDEVKEELKEELLKREINVTLGGHSLQFLLKESIKEKKLENVFLFESEILQEILVKKIIDYIKEFKLITRISLWPEDLSIERHNGQEFFKSYLSFVKYLQKEIDRQALGAEVEFIAYNAGLSWEMLEVTNYEENLKDVNALFAYWGHNYGDYHEKNSLRGMKTLEKLTSKCSSTTVLEYYSDFFMLSEIYPSLLRRIETDMNYYERLKLEGVLNLHVPYFTAHHFDQFKEKYNYQRIHQLNNTAYSYLGFNPTLASLHIEERNVHLEVEDVLAPLTKYNTVLFPNRLTDVKNPEYQAIISKELMEAKTKMKEIKIESHTLKVYQKLIIEILSAYQESWDTLID